MKLTDTSITVHGREALDLPYKRWETATNGASVQTDLSSSILYIEIPSANIRKLLTTDAGDAKGKRITLTRAEVEMIPTTASAYILLDETDPAKPFVELEGTITRTGYHGQPT